MELIVQEPAKRNGVTEQPKAENQMEWVRQMNACKAQAEAIVKFELIYDWYRDRPDENVRAVLVQTVDFFIIFWYNLFEKVRDKSEFAEVSYGYYSKFILYRKNGAAKEFVREMISSRTVQAIKEESGNLKYDYFIKVDDQDTVLLIDSWES